MSMKVWNIINGTEETIATGGPSVDRLTAQFYNASGDDVEVTVKVTDNTGGVSGSKIIKKFTLVAAESNHYHVNQLESSDTVAVTAVVGSGESVNLNIVTWN